MVCTCGTHVGTMNRCLPSPLCSQVILGMGANATAAPNTTARAVIGPPVGAHILLGGATAGLQQQMPVGSEVAARIQWVTQSPRALTCSTAWS